jgi:hypothetical protein
MGIQGYYEWIKTNYPSCVAPMNKIKFYDHVMIDLNHILHNVIYNVNNEKQFIAKIYKALDHILSRCVPLKSIYLGIDGPPPYAKISLQRKRRSGGGETYTDKIISSLCLTPGTILMSGLKDHLDKYFIDRKSWYKFRKITVHISPSCESGEGEIKIFHHIQQNISQMYKDSFLIIGNDADLVVLGMASQPIYNLNILIKTKFQYELVSVSNLLLCVNQQINPWLKVIDPYFLRDSILRRDFAVVSMMMGNDYLIKLSYVKIGNLWNSYFETKKNRKYGDCLINNDNLFNISFLINWMKLLTTTLAIQFQKFNPEHYKKTNVKEYLEGFLWCLNMYQTGACPKVDYLYELSAPSPPEIIYYFEQKDKDNICPLIPKSNIKTVAHDIYPLLVMPKKAYHLIDPKYHQIMTQEIDELHEREMCDKCTEIRGKLSKMSKILYSQQKENEDTEDTKKILATISKEMTSHEKLHKNLTILEIVNIVTKAVGMT